MRSILSILVMTLLVAACNSKKSTEETKTTGPSDTMVAPHGDTDMHTMPHDTVPARVAPESIGGLSQGMTDSSTSALLGQPDSKSKVEEWGADGLFHQDWMYRSKGITLNMSGEKKGAPQQIFSITVTKPSDLKTARNMGIGSDYKDVMAAYHKDVDHESSDENSIVVGSVYGGMIFSFKDNKVERIFIGAAAE